MEESYFKIIFMGGGAIGYVIIALSVVTVAMAVRHFTQIRRSTILPAMTRQQIQSLFENKQYREAIDITGNGSDFLSHIMHAALVESPHGYVSMERAMEEAAEQRTTKLLRDVEWLNLIGNVAPMLGLLGTVWGMIDAFFRIKESAAGGGGVQIESLSGGIALALVTTLLGLAVAIPALAVYGFMRNRIDSLSSEAMLSAEDLIANFRPKKGAAAASASVQQQN